MISPHKFAAPQVEIRTVTFPLESRQVPIGPSAATAEYAGSVKTKNNARSLQIGCGMFCLSPWLVCTLLLLDV